MLAGDPARIFSRVAFVVIWTGSCEWTAEADRIRIGRRRARNLSVEFFMASFWADGGGMRLSSACGCES